ncbi:MAG: sugar phosphate isomerase/epimerase family protein [Planctomycetota bacterium]
MSHCRLNRRAALAAMAAGTVATHQLLASSQSATASAFTSWASTALGVAAASQTQASATQSTVRPKLALNTSTIRGQKLSVSEQISVTAKAGYDGIEPWIRDLREHAEKHGSVRDLKQQLSDVGLDVSGAIGFAKWIVDDASQRSEGLDEAKRDMEMVRELGGRYMAAPPVGAHRAQDIAASGPPTLPMIAERYAELLQVGKSVGVTPLLELWGFSPVLSRLAELAYVSTASEQPNAAVLPDFYHIYKGGNDFTGLGMIEASRMPLFHINDYPDVPVAQIGDKDRVFPGDGVCPLVDTVAMLLKHGFTGTFSLELFNRDYWQRPAQEVANEGQRKCAAIVDAAIQSVESEA